MELTRSLPLAYLTPTDWTDLGGVDLTDLTDSTDLGGVYVWLLKLRWPTGSRFLPLAGFSEDF